MRHVTRKHCKHTTRYFFFFLFFFSFQMHTVSEDGGLYITALYEANGVSRSSTYLE
jgi:hypothetical protein